MRLNPDSARAMLASAKLAVYMGQTDAAFEQIRKGLKLDPMNSEMLLFKAATFHYLARPTEEEGVYREIIANRPNDWVAYNELGRVLRDRANYTEAVKALSRATQIAPKVSMPLANLGVAYALSGQDEQARVSFERSIALYPQVIAYIGLGDLAFKAGDYRGALARFDKAHDLDPKRDDVLRDLGDCYFMLGQMGKMRECFQQALASLSELLATAPKNPPGWMVHSLYEAKLGHFAEAENDIRTAEAQGGRDLYARFTKSQTLAVMGQKEESLGLLLGCLREGLPIQEVALAVDLSGARADPRYQEFVARRSQPGVSPS
jgi:tetratricopeptide (TPR) repeat protein